MLLSGMADSLDDSLWNTEVTAANYDAAGEKYQNAILEQYKIYVEMADRVSARRTLANTFFLTINTAILSSIGIFWTNKPSGSVTWLAIPLAAVLTLCTAWFYILRSYRQLNSGKYKVVGALETRLPASPYWRAEWAVLGEGADRSKYWPLTHLERWIPVTFGIIYIVGFVLALVV